MFVSSALSIVLFLIFATDASKRVADPVAYEKAVVARRGMRYQKVLMRARKILLLIFSKCF